MEFFTPDGPKQLLAELCRLVRDRAESETAIEAGLVSGKESADKYYRDAQEGLVSRVKAEKESVESEYVSAKNEIIAKYESDTQKLQEEYESAREKAVARFKDSENKLQQQFTENRWEAMAMSEAARGGSNLQAMEIVAGLESRWQELQTIHQQAVDLLRERGLWRDFPESEAVALALETDPAQRFSHAIEVARKQYHSLTQLFMPRVFQRFYQGLWPLFIFLLLWAVAACPAGFAIGWKNWQWVPVSGVAAFVVFLVAGIWIYRAMNRQAANGYLALRHTMLEAGLNQPVVLEQSKTQCQRQFGDIFAKQDAEMKKIEQKFAAATAEIQRRKDRDLQIADETYPPRLAELSATKDHSIPQIDEIYEQSVQDIDSRFAAEMERLSAEHAQSLKEIDERYRIDWAAMSEHWLTGIARIRTGLDEINSRCGEFFPNWHTDDWIRWTPPLSIPPAYRFGGGQLDLKKLEGGIPADEKLRPEETEFDIPAFLPFPQNSLLLWKASGPGLGNAVDSMQAVMLRMLTAMPPGKVRFTIIDPVGLGENFSAFMHLADFDEQLIANRIWTDMAHIEQRLADLTKHMENVLQVYLRNEFKTIQEYNDFAGEMAEPYHVLVVANFPTNFSEVAAQRLKSIVASGARCGVFVLMSIDTNMPLSRQFHLPDLEQDALVLRWDESRFVVDQPEYGPFPLDLDTPPQPELFREIVRSVGSQAKDAGRVEVPFSCIIPTENEWWTSDSRAGIDVPLGRAGALKLQNLALGSGTSQHVLISGKTGSGKSTLLHVLITNLALRYSPDEIELYLVDFKKGVEFKTYAHNALPHARVIAIESEREFGLSVLQRLDGELRTRGDMFRKQGVQDLKGYRAGQPNERLPRILLIIDEFQELFTEDDRIAQESSLLLDRLVRQGRAFGIHVLLGSQTLGGAYSLARSTIGQMAVRIALQCSESDAHLILSEDNTAAKLLTRPGEAIYNDANGLYEGNHPFQIVWLADSDRDHYLKEINKLTIQKQLIPETCIIFEGNVPANPSDNPGLKELVAAKSWPEMNSTPRAWLGSAVSIKEPTAATFLRQNGSNLLLVGHREEAALGLLANCIISLGTQYAPSSGVKFYILDGMRGDAPEVGFWPRLESALPHAITVANTRTVNDTLAEITADLAARQEHPEEHRPPVYVVVYNLARFRDLRKEDDFSFSSMDDGKPANPAKQFGSILREGPGLGIHTLIWCDTYNNVSRFMDRQTLRDFEMRVLFQMNATDSSNLMDTPDASRLSSHVAIFYDEGQGRMEKFRPYGLPPMEWLNWLKTQLPVETI